MKSSMTSIRVIYVHREREKVDFKSREVNCLKDCALALMYYMHKYMYMYFRGMMGIVLCQSLSISISVYRSPSTCATPARGSTRVTCIMPLSWCVVAVALLI